MHLFLVRHGESYVNLADWDGGWLDTGLTDLGKRQAEAVAQWLHEHVAIDALYTSTMARARDTAAYLTAVTGLDAVPDDRLREFGNCYADGRPIPLDNGNAISYPDDWWGTERPNTRISTDGESWMLFRVRVSAFISEIVEKYRAREPQAAVVVVCHGGVIEAAFDHVFNIGEQRSIAIWIHNTGIMHLEYRGPSERDMWRLHAHNMAFHLLTDGGVWLGAGPILSHATRGA